MIVYAIITGVCFAWACIVTSMLVASSGTVRFLASSLRTEQAITADLHNRLSARSYETYAALQPDFVASHAAPPIPNRMYDETGLIEIDLPDDDG
jgi:hypothetical protein